MQLSYVRKLTALLVGIITTVVVAIAAPMRKNTLSISTAKLIGLTSF